MTNIRMENYTIEADWGLAILRINPNAIFSGDCNNINWLEGTTPISKEDIQDEIDKMRLEFEADEWKRNRQTEYPTHEDCIHALLDGGDTLTELQEKRQTVKTKYPKP